MVDPHAHGFESSGVLDSDDLLTYFRFADFAVYHHLIDEQHEVDEWALFGVEVGDNLERQQFLLLLDFAELSIDLLHPHIVGDLHHQVVAVIDERVDVLEVGL
jgi:hypothetical protein